MKKIIFVFIGLLLFLGSCLSFSQERKLDQIEKLLYEAVESSYFDGQRAALEGDIRIQKVPYEDDSCWVWLKSPWPDSLNREPIFNPCK